MSMHPAHWMNYPDSLKNKRVFGVTAGAAVITVSTLMVLNEAWYKNFPKSEFQNKQTNLPGSLQTVVRSGDAPKPLFSIKTVGGGDKGLTLRGLSQH